MRRKNRKYCDDYLSFGFICRGSEDEQKSQCVLCSEILSNESMNPAKLCLHFETKHKEHTNKPVEYFQRRWQELLSRQNVIKKITTGCDKKNAVSASYGASLLIAKNGKPHTIAEELILPAAKAIASRMHRDKISKHFDLIPLSNTTVKWRIEDMSENVKNQLVKRVIKSPYNSLQLYESTEAMIMKLDLWSECLQSGVFEPFPTLCDFLETSEENISEEIRNLFTQQLQDLKISFRDYFPPCDANNKWIWDPFHVDVNELTTKENSLVELSCDTSLQSCFSRNNLSDFWLLLKNEYPELATKALIHLMPFPTTYLREQAFSQLTYIKSKYRNRMNVKPDLHLKLSSIGPKIQNLLLAKQHQRSH